MKTFFLMLAAAFMGALAVVVIVWGYIVYQTSRGETARFPPRGPEEVVQSVPPVEAYERFYGSHGSWFGDFPDDARRKVLAAGPGRITGTVSASGKPAPGVRLRIALNGAVMSQWATSGADGKYEVALPYGKYLVNGHELDSKTVDRALSGKIDAPRYLAPNRDPLTVAEGRPARGPDLVYVDPVKRTEPSGEVSLGKPVIASWEPYPGAAAYRLQVTEQRSAHDFSTMKQLFQWRDRPVVEATRADLGKLGVKLKKGYYYRVEIEALDKDRHPLSEAPRHSDGAGFKAVD